MPQVLNTSLLITEGFYAFGCAALLAIFYELAGSGRKHARALGSDVYRVYMGCGVVTLFVWLLYPVAWGVCEGGNVIAPDSEAVFYGILDLPAWPSPSSRFSSSSGTGVSVPSVWACALANLASPLRQVFTGRRVIMWALAMRLVILLQAMVLPAMRQRVVHNAGLLVVTRALVRLVREYIQAKAIIPPKQRSLSSSAVQNSIERVLNGQEARTFANRIRISIMRPTRVS